MYCSTCELEIKGDEKQTCPICGSPLKASSGVAGTSNGNASQEQTAIHEIIDDINSLIDQDATGPAEDVFVLKDYESDSQDASAEDAEIGRMSEETPASAAPPTQEADAQSLPMDDNEQEAGVPLGDMLDSIRQSMDGEAHKEDDMSNGASGQHESDEQDDVDGAIELSAGDNDTSDDQADDSADFMAEYKQEEADVSDDRAGARRRSPVVMIAFFVVLVCAAGYYAYGFYYGGEAGDDGSKTVRTVLPFASLQKDVEKSPRLVQKHGTPAAASEQAAGTGTGAGQVQQMSAGTDASDVPEASVGEDAPVVMEKSKALHAQSSVPELGEASQDSPAAETPSVQTTPATAKNEPDKPADMVSAGPKDQTAAAAPAEETSPEKAASLPVQQQPVQQTQRPAGPFYTVHVGSFRSRSVAVSEQRRIAAKGYDAFIERADLGQRGIWFRVKVGRFKTKAEAASLKSKIHNVLVSDSIVVLNR